MTILQQQQMTAIISRLEAQTQAMQEKVEAMMAVMDHLPVLADQVFSIQQVAKLSGRSTRTIHQHIADGKLPPQKTFSGRQVIAYIQTYGKGKRKGEA